MPTIDLTTIINAVIALLAALVTYRLIPWIKARTTTEQQAQLKAAIKVAVFAAEQIFGAGHGEEKMDYALRWLREQGFEIDSRQVEAAVAEYLNLVLVTDYVGQPEPTPKEPPDASAVIEEPAEQYFESGAE